MTFREAYDRTGRILNVSCVPSDPHSPTILANYLTSPDCVIWSAVLASAAVPGILNPVVLMKKTKEGTLTPYSFGHKWKDGSLRTDIPLKSLNLHFNVRFSIVSQVNPHINLFFFSSRGSVGRPVTHRRGRGWRGGFLGSAIEQYIKLDLTKWLKVLRHLELLPRPLGQDWSEIWLQRFSGTITIWPKSIPSDFYYILSDPTPQRLGRMIHVGQQSAFPKLKFIANRAKLEHLIQQGRRQSRPRGAQDGLASILSEDDIQGLLKRTKSDGPDGNSLQKIYSDSESSDSGPSRPGSPISMPLGFSFTTKREKSAPARISAQASNSKTATPDSPSLGKRLTGWFSPRNNNNNNNNKPSSKRAPKAAPYLHDRPSSMFELGAPREQREQILAQILPQQGTSSPGHLSPIQRTGSFLQELRRQSRVFVDDETEPDDYPAGFENAERRYETRGGRGGAKDDTGPGADGYEGGEDEHQDQHVEGKNFE